MFALSLDWEVCPDGVEAVHMCGGQPVELSEPGSQEFEFVRGIAPPKGSPINLPATVLYRPRTDRRRPVHYAMTTLENLIALRFVNAAQRSRFGAPSGDRSLPPSAGPTWFLSRFGMLRHGEPVFREDIGRDLAVIDAALRAAGGVNEGDAVSMINSLLAGEVDQPKARPPYPIQPIRLVPMVEFTDAGRPVLTLRPQTLFQFMIMEISMVAAHRAQFAECEHCGEGFLTGPLTGRRSTARFCGDRCRQAAMRARSRNEKDL